MEKKVAYKGREAFESTGGGRITLERGGLNVTRFVSEINLSGHFPNSCFESAWTEIGQGHRNSLNDCFVNAVILSRVNRWEASNQHFNISRRNAKYTRRPNFEVARKKNNV